MFSPIHRLLKMLNVEVETFHNYSLGIVTKISIVYIVHWDYIY